MMKKALLRTSIPLIIMSVLSFMLFLIGKTSTEYLGTLYTGLIIASVSGATIIYEFTNWSLAKQSLVHFLIMLFTVFPILVFSNWFPNTTFQDIVYIFAIFLVIGFFMWVAAYFINTKFLKS